MKKTICFDIDNTICKTVGNDYKNAKPHKAKVLLINKLYEKGHIIKFFTSRFMGRTNDNATEARKKAKKITLSQLKKWNMKFHKIYFGKPSSDFYVDDKNLNFKSNWTTQLKRLIKQ